MPATTWKKWRVGLWLAIGMGCLSAGAGLCAGIKWQAFVAILCTSIATHIGAYLLKSPLDDVQDDSTNNQKP